MIKSYGNFILPPIAILSLYIKILRATQNFVMNTTTKVSVVFKIVNISINVTGVKANILLFIVLISKLYISYQHQELFKRPIQSHQLFASQATNIKQTPFVRTGSTPVKVDTICPYLSVYPNKSIADELKNGFRFGFYLHYQGP